MITKASWAGAVVGFAVAGAIFTTSSVFGAVVTLQTAGNATTGGQPVSARAIFTTSTNQVSIVLENLQADPTSVVQCLSGLQFTLSSGQTAGTLSSSLGLERSVDSGGAFSDGSSAATGWALSTVGSSLKLNVLGTPGAPNHTIIGPPDVSSVYANANSSITNGTHSPFMGNSATFVLNVSGVTDNSTITDGIFQFNTAPGSTVPGITVGGFPEPTGALMASGMVGVLVAARNRRRRSVGL